MSTNQLLPVWMTVGATSTAPGTQIKSYSMAASITSDAVKYEWEDNVSIHAVWTGTPTGVLDVQLSLDPVNLGWQSVPFTPTPDAPSGSNGSNWYDITQTAAAYVRLVYTFTSGTGSLSAQIAMKSV